MTRYLGHIRWAEAELGIRILTPEYEVTSILFDVARITPLEMRHSFSGSDASFFKILKSLEARDVVCAEPNPTDGRSKLYRLSNHASSVLSRQWSEYKKIGPSKAYQSGDHGQVMHNYSKTLTGILGVRQFTSEFQILMYVYSCPGLASVKFQNLVSVSQAKMNMSIRALSNAGSIYHTADTADGRRKLYYLPERNSDIISELTTRIFLWLDSKPRAIAAAQ